MKHLVNKRILARLYNGMFKCGVCTTEYRVLEVSPSGLSVKLCDLNMNTLWKPISDVVIVEELIDRCHD